jgi:hypothetical protein
MERLVLADRYQWLQEAENASAVLRSEGIPSMLSGDAVLRADWLRSGGLGGIDLRVRASDADRADDLLDAVSVGFDEELVAVADPLPEQAAAPDECPRCGSREVRPVPKRAVAVFLTVLTGSLILLGNGEPGALAGLLLCAFAALWLLVDDWRCGGCGTLWS